MKNSSYKTLFICAVVLFWTACSEKNTPNYHDYYGDDNNSGGNSSTGVAPTPQFTCQLKQPFVVTFTNSSSGNPTKFSWDFGDGSTSTEKNPTHKYTSTGKFIVTLTASNNAGSNSLRKTITISEPKIYISGIKYLEVGYNSKYYKAVYKDDDFFTTTWFNTSYTPLLSNSMLPYEYNFSSPILMDGLKDDNYYYIYIYWNNKTNGNGTQIMKQKMYTSDIMKYPDQITLTNDNGDTKVGVMFSYK